MMRSGEAASRNRYPYLLAGEDYIGVGANLRRGELAEVVKWRTTYKGAEEL